jgi:hypothetical protein
VAAVVITVAAAVITVVAADSTAAGGVEKSFARRVRRLAGISQFANGKTVCPSRLDFRLLPSAFLLDSQLSTLKHQPPMGAFYYGVEKR